MQMSSSRRRKRCINRVHCGIAYLDPFQEQLNKAKSCLNFEHSLFFDDMEISAFHGTEVALSGTRFNFVGYKLGR